MLSQGCRPFGRLLTVTRVERNLVLEIAGRPAMECMVDQIAEHLGRTEIAGIEGNGLLLGRCVDAGVLDPGPGDLLFRPLQGVERATGALAVEDRVPLGSAVQFALRDAGHRVATIWPPRWPAGGPTPPCCSPATAGAPGCSTWPTTTHRLVSRSLGPVPLGGLFAAGEFGPVGGRQLRAQLRRVAGPVPGAIARRSPVSTGPAPAGRVWPMPTPPPSPLVPAPSGELEQRGDRRHPRPGHRRSPGGQLGPSRARPWRWHRWPTSCSPGSCATTRPIRTGPTATGSCCPTGTPRSSLYSMLYLTGYGLTLDDLRAFRSWGSRHTGPPRAPPHRRGRGHHRARSARASPTVSAWASPSGGCAPTSPPSCATTTPTWWPATAASRRASPTRRRRWPATCGLGRLVYVYDDNHITIDGPTELSLNDNAGRAVRRLRVGGRRHRRVGQRPRRPRGGPAAGPGRRGPPVPHHPAQPHRLPGPPPDRHGQGPRRPVRATTRPDSPRRSSGSRPTRRSGCPTTCSAMYRSTIPRGQAMRAEWEARFAGVGRRPGPVGRRPERPRAARLGGEAAHVHPGRRPHGHPQGHQGVPRRHRTTSCPASCPGAPT